MPDLIVLLLSFPISVVANFSSDFIRNFFKKHDDKTLKSLFIRSFFKSLDSNFERVDSVGKEAITQCKSIVKGDENKLLQIISDCLLKDSSFLSNPRDESLIDNISAVFCEQFNLSHISLAKNVIKDCFRNYEVAFYSEMSTKEGIIHLITLLKRIDNDIARKKDIEHLKQVLVDEIGKTTIKNINVQKAASLIKEEIVNPESNLFSESVVSGMSKLKKKIEKLTQDQFQLMNTMRYKKRVIISGCAGSGKTLLAAEKAVRLDSAGIKTLILTHNPHLVLHIRNLVADSQVDVFDFTNFIKQLICEPFIELAEWNEFIEPLEEELSRALNLIIDKHLSYDAIIIDEGQDFRELWWMIIEALSINSENKMLYIFHDDSQLLLPFASKYPIEEELFHMSKNCRNAGLIFEVVRKFHFKAPLTSDILKETGILKMTTYASEKYKDIIAKSLYEASTCVDLSQLTIITNEASVTQSVLNGMEVPLGKRWQEKIGGDLSTFAKIVEKKIVANLLLKVPDATYALPMGVSIDSLLTIPSLSDKLYPTKEDITKVGNFAKKIARYLTVGGRRIEEINAKDTDSKTDVSIRGARTHSKEIVGDYTPVINLYVTGNWIYNPKYLSVARIVSYGEAVSTVSKQKQINVISVNLVSIDSFKGLESDSVLLFVNTMNKDIFREFYVGTSRAVGYLHMLINRTVYEKIHQLKDLEQVYM